MESYVDRYRSPSGFTSETSAGTRPHTPPYTPIARGKRRFERSDSRASSIHPAETSSPAKKAAKRTVVADDIQVEELAEDDTGYFTDIDVVYPEELEEVNSSDGDDELSSSDADAHSDATGITRRLSRLRCGDETAEANFEKERRRRHLRKRMSPRLVKRSHSQSMKGDTEDTDADAIDDQDLASSQRRLRRRVRGPLDSDVVLEEISVSPPEPGSVRPSPEWMQSPETPIQNRRSCSGVAESDAMDLDDST